MDFSGMESDAHQSLTIVILDTHGAMDTVVSPGHQTTVEVVKFGTEDNV
jgi:hypothetical protein